MQGERTELEARRPLLCGYETETVVRAVVTVQERDEDA